MLKLGPRGGRFLHGIVIAMAAPLASLGVTLGCFIRNVIFYPAVFGPALDHRMPGTGLGDFVGSAVFAVLGAIWLIALAAFIRPAPRSPLTIVLTILALVIFGFAAWQNWLMAYPVCNPF
jgi:hypothetical protein